MTDNLDANGKPYDFRWTQPTDQKWLDALQPYLGGGVVPFFKNFDGTVNAQATIDNFCSLYDIQKVGSNGEPL